MKRIRDARLTTCSVKSNMVCMFAFVHFALSRVSSRRGAAFNLGAASVASPLPPGDDRRVLGLIVEGVLAAILIAIGTARIVDTYSTLSNTCDEGVHVACGLEWWARGTTAEDPPNGPLGRILIGAIPYMRGIEFQEGMGVWDQGNHILLSENNYQSTLSAARAGVLPLFWAASIGVWLWSRRLFGAWPGLGGLLLFTNLPTILAHSGLATTDMAITATFVWFVWSFAYWLDKPDFSRTIVLALSFSLAFVSKFSVLPFGMASAVTIASIRWFLQPPGSETRGWRVWLKSAGVFTAVSYLVVWAFYRFSVWSVADICLQKGWLNLEEHPWLIGSLRLLVPGRCFHGVASVMNHVRIGQEAFLMGEVYYHGRWYFYPFDLALKTPLAFLFLAVWGIWITARNGIRHRDWRVIVPGASAVAVLLSILTSSLNLGIRYLLPIYPLMAVASAGGLPALWSKSGWRRAFVVGLIGWTVVSSALHHPDYLAYFNELAGPKPEIYLVESDLDWGQDALRLRDKLTELGVERFSISYFGNFDFDRMGFPPHEDLVPGQPVKGWVAVSLTKRALHPKNFAWLRGHDPVCRVGKSIDLYYINE